HAIAASDAPLVDAVRAGELAGLGDVVRVGGTIATVGVLLSLIAGVSRTTFAMAADRELPGWYDAVHPAHRVPHRAVLDRVRHRGARGRGRSARGDRVQLVLRARLL